jgi:hypothetical protein
VYQELGIMSEIMENQPDKKGSLVFYGALSYCLAIPSLGTIALLVVLANTPWPTPVFGWAACIYVSSVAVGLFTLTGVGKISKTVKMWLPVVGIALSSILGALSLFMWVCCHLAVSR